MTRTPYDVRVLDESGATIGEQTTFAMNSGIRAGEAHVRRIAREEETRYSGEHPTRVGDVYTRQWVSALGRLVVVRVERRNPQD